MLDVTARDIAKKVRLLQPQDTKGEIAEIFEDIRRTKGANFLTPCSIIDRAALGHVLV